MGKEESHKVCFPVQPLSTAQGLTDLSGGPEESKASLPITEGVAIRIDYTLIRGVHLYPQDTSLLHIPRPWNPS
uniref:Uncharacterized protein n=1 Tax=Oryza sativa subsp. japonica TaxID=39947 RepID=Q2QP68_ORYSJ|nr:hypothetical protein LOC_Os12g35520 [Oryza sativa Japonica Group]